MTIQDKSLIPGLIHYFCSYIKQCHICKLARNDKPPMRQLQTRINLNYKPLSRLSMDLKVMPRSNKGHKYILCITDEVKIIYLWYWYINLGHKEIGGALIENVISKYYAPNYMIIDQDSAFMFSLMNYLFKKLDIKIKTVAPYYHQLL